MSTTTTIEMYATRNKGEHTVEVWEEKPILDGEIWTGRQHSAYAFGGGEMLAKDAKKMGIYPAAMGHLVKFNMTIEKT